MKVRIGDQLLTKEIATWIADDSADWLKKYSRGELVGNLMLPYVVLYYHLKDQAKIVKNYLGYVDNL